MTQKIFIIAGEASGDLLGAALMRDLKQQQPDLVFAGIGGQEMAKEGLESLFPMQDLSVMGLTEVLKHLPRLVKRFYQTTDAILKQQPDLVVTIDSPDFCFRIAAHLKKKQPGLRLVHMVAPTVWAWRPKRAEKIAGFLDGLMCLFPFEPPYFTKHGLRTAFIGHPLAKQILPFSEEEKQAFLARYNIPQDAPVLCVLPGSRNRELEFLWPVFGAVIERLKTTVPGLKIIVPTLPHLAGRLTRPDIILLTDTKDKYLAMQTATAALHASGTVALELALSGTPMVTAYKVSPMTARIAKRLIKTPYINLVNLLIGRPVVPELVQDEATVETITPLVQGLLRNNVIHDSQASELVEIKQILQEPESAAAARFVLSFLPTKPASE